METKKLSDNQLEHFNTDLMLPNYWDTFLSLLEQKVDTSRQFSILDIGGGIGLFADKLLKLYPNAIITVLDNSEYLLSLNKPHERKKILNASATNLKEDLGNEKYDVITFNWVLHHLVSSHRNDSLKNVEQTLHYASQHLKVNGYISIIENLYNGLIIDSIPSRLIFMLTSIKIKPLAYIIRKAGFNTAGVGVNFMSEKIITKLISKAGLTSAGSKIIDCWEYNIIIRLILHTKPMKMRNIWCNITQK